MVLLAAAAVQIAYYFPRLPDVVASHFNAAGTPNSWEPKQLFLWLYVIVLLAITAVGLLVPRVILTVPPEMINLPNKDYWLAPERRAMTMEYFLDHFSIFAAGTLTLIVCVFQLVFVADLSGASGLPSTSPWVLLAGYFIFAAIWMTTLFLKFRRA